uniref:SFRICE_025040 n=1 Tax=Spodoptera frugiperda TaxID=7108 RepID=A0A2H1V1U7_SPOFR
MVVAPSQSARSEGESSGEQSCESSDEGVGRDAPGSLPHQPHQPMQSHQGLQSHQSLQHQNMTHQPSHNMSHHGSVQHQPLNSHQMSHQHQRNSPRPLERELKVRDDFESLKSSLHPHLSSLASLAQGTPLSTPSSVFALAGAGATGGFPYAPPAFLAPAPPPPAQPAGSASSSSSEGSAAGWSFEEQYKQVRQLIHDSDNKREITIRLVQTRKWLCLVLDLYCSNWAELDDRINLDLNYSIQNLML